MSDAKTPTKKVGWLKAGLVGLLGLFGGAAGTYATALVDKAVRPTKPVANFAVVADGLTVTCQNHATGESGWWDFGDGTPLEPFAPDKPVSHTFSRPGTYPVKLTVRNFVADENERTVPVDVSVGGKDALAAGPQLADLVVQPVSPIPVAPATFRVTGRLSNADHCVWDLGDGRVEVTAGGERIDRLVTFEKPGAFQVEVIAHNGKHATRQTTPVIVATPREGSLLAVLRVTDTGTRTERLTRSESVVVPVGKQPGAGFTKVVPARPGFGIVAAGIAAPTLPGVRNPHVHVAADRRTATVAGEWAVGSKDVARAVGGSDLIVPVTLTEERTVAVPAAATVVTGPFIEFGLLGGASLPLPVPPAGLAGPARDLTLEIRHLGPGGKPVVLKTVKLPVRPPGQLLWAEALPVNGITRTFAAVQEGDTVKVTIGR